MTSWLPMAGELRTARLSLGPWHDDDLDALELMVRDRDVRSGNGPEVPRTELWRRIQRRHAELAETGIALLAVRLDGAFAGYCGLIVGQSSLDEPEIAYELLGRFRNRGYATEAGHAVTVAARATGRERLWATVRPWNAPSFRVLTKLGFADSGRVTEDDAGDLRWWTRTL